MSLSAAAELTAAAVMVGEASAGRSAASESEAPKRSRMSVKLSMVAEGVARYSGESTSRRRAMRAGVLSTLMPTPHTGSFIRVGETALR